VKHARGARRAATLVAALASGAGAAQAEPATYGIDPTHTFVNFEVPHRGTSITRGRWDRKDGTVTLDRQAKAGRAEITIEMDSVNTGVPAFDRALRGKAFFDVASHPQARFVGERFVFEGERVVEVGGLLTIRGRTQPVTLKARLFNCYTNPLFRREVCGGDFEATIRSSDWGVGQGLPEPAPDAVRLLIQVEAIRQ
jgi:polyisoprenoid-binding protein YceI